jgi:hypothetical protein
LGGNSANRQQSEEKRDSEHHFLGLKQLVDDLEQFSFTEQVD